MATWYPRALRWSAVAHPQYPSPPMIMTRVPAPEECAVPGVEASAATALTLTLSAAALDAFFVPWTVLLSSACVRERASERASTVRADFRFEQSDHTLALSSGGARGRPSVRPVNT